jgi:hypothetical protein
MATPGWASLGSQFAAHRGPRMTQTQVYYEKNSGWFVGKNAAVNTNITA